MRNLQIYPLFIVSVIIIITTISCNSTQKIIPSKYNPNFGYVPEERKEISQSSLTVAIIDPVFSDGEENNLYQPYEGFVRNMGDDIEEALNANGFKIRGPYKNRDEMVYGDKLDSDFALEIEIEILTENQDFGARDVSFARKMVCETCYRLGGTFYHNGRIIITATDPIDGEKFWKKTITLERKPVVTNGIKDDFNGTTTDQEVLSDVGIYNPIAKVLESYYAESISSISRQIDPREMEQISKQIKAKRDRVGQ